MLGGAFGVPAELGNGNLVFETLGRQYDYAKRLDRTNLAFNETTASLITLALVQRPLLLSDLD